MPNESVAVEGHVETAEAAVALAEAQTALANVAAAKVVAESNDEMAKVKENIECMNLKMTELEASLAETRSQLQAFQSSIPPKESEPPKESAPEPPKESAPEPPKESAPEPPKESASLASVEAENPEAKMRRKHRQVRRI